MPRHPESDPHARRERAHNAMPLYIGRATQACETHPNRNEDSSVVWGTERGANIIGVFDGMGGHPNGDIASRVAGEVVLESIAAQEAQMTHDDQYFEMVANALRRAHESVQREQQRLEATGQVARGSLHMGTTACVVTFTPERDGNRRAYLGHIGDSRVYRYRRGQLEHLTLDHSGLRKQKKGKAPVDYRRLHDPNLRPGTVDQELLRGQQELGKTVIPEEREGEFRFRNVVAQSLGIGEINPDVFEVDCEPDDVFLVLTDGITDPLTNNKIAKIVELYRGRPMEMMHALVAAADAVKGARAKPDDRTGIVVETYNAEKAKEELPHRAPAPRDTRNDATDLAAIDQTAAQARSARRRVASEEQEHGASRIKKRSLTVGERVRIPGRRGEFEIVRFNSSTGDAQLIAVTVGNRWDRWLLDAPPVGVVVEHPRMELIEANPQPDLRAIKRITSIRPLAQFLEQFPSIPVYGTETPGADLAKLVLRVLEYPGYVVNLPDTYGLRAHVEKLLKKEKEAK